MVPIGHFSLVYKDKESPPEGSLSELVQNWGRSGEAKGRATGIPPVRPGRITRKMLGAFLPDEGPIPTGHLNQTILPILCPSSLEIRKFPSQGNSKSMCMWAAVYTKGLHVFPFGRHLT